MAFNTANKEKAMSIVDQYPYPKSAILPLAHLAQDQDGYLSNEAMAEIADIVGVTPAEVNGTCSFYTMFKREPVGKLLVSVCTNVTCLVVGGPEIHETLTKKYLSDEEVTIEEVECLAKCDGAPCFQVNYEFFENVTPQNAIDIVEDYKSGNKKARTISGSLIEEQK
ncbi:MAG: NAD(P)H-dependent oxidoreductase subunit E [Acidimicrobiia bacterium]